MNQSLSTYYDQRKSSITEYLTNNKVKPPPIINQLDARRARMKLHAMKTIPAMQIINLLCQNEEKADMCVTDIFVALRMEQSIASMHLAKLRSVWIVKANRIGNHIYYHMIPEEFERIARVVKELSRMIDDTIDVRLNAIEN